MADKPERCGRAGGSGMTRRKFITSIGAGGVAFSIAGTLAARPVEAAEEAVLSATDTVKLAMNINGRDYAVLVEPRYSLLYVLREQLGLTGTKVGCERGECGACTVLIDDVPRYACMTLAVETEGTRITTLEGLMQGERLGPVQQAFAESDAFQCGYCTPGQIMAVEGLLRATPSPSDDEIRRGVSGNLCRCGAYARIFKAAGQAARMKRGR